MPGTTPLGLVVPLDSDPLALVHQFIRDLATQLDTKTIRKAADETVNNSATLQADNELAFSAVAGETYEGELVLFFSTNNSAIDVKIGFSHPAGTMCFGVVGLDPADAAGTVGDAQVGAIVGGTSGTSFLAVGVGGATLPDACMVRVTFTFVCTVSGTVTLLWAQNTATAADMILKAGSKLKAQVL